MISCYRLACMAILAFALVIGCGGGGGSEGPPDPARPPALELIGYGVPNACHEVNPEELGDALVNAGLGLTVCEWMPWFTEEGPGCKHNGGLSDQTFPVEMGEFVDVMRARGIVTALFGVNANNCEVRSEWGIAEFTELNSHVLTLGANHVWLLPVNEPWVGSSKAPSWAHIGRESWSGVFLVPDKGRNHYTGEPYFSVPHDFVTVNACTDSAAEDALRRGGSRTLVTTDCTGTLNPGPERAARLAGIARETGTAFVVYDFRGRSIDHGVIAAMGAK